MKQFVFRLQSLLKIRRNQREQCQLLLSDALRADEKLKTHRQELEASCTAQLAEFKKLSAPGQLNIDSVASRRYFAVQLTGEIRYLDQQRILVGQRIELCRQALVKADQAVKSLEKLEEKQRLEFLAMASRREDRELDEIWPTLNAVKRGQGARESDTPQRGQSSNRFIPAANRPVAVSGTDQHGDPRTTDSPDTGRPWP